MAQRRRSTCTKGRRGAPSFVFGSARRQWREWSEWWPRPASRAASSAIPRRRRGGIPVRPPQHRGHSRLLPPTALLPTQRFDLHTSTSPTADGRTIVFLHGGAWRSGSRAEIPALVLDRSSRRLEHRLGLLTGSRVPTLPTRCAHQRGSADQIGDVKLALRFIKAHADELGISARRVVVGGYSAGAHLATIAALSPRAMEPPAAQMDARTRSTTSAVAGYVNFNGPTDLAATLRSTDRIGESYLAPPQLPCSLRAWCAPITRRRARLARSRLRRCGPARCQRPAGLRVHGWRRHAGARRHARCAARGDGHRRHRRRGRVWLDVAESGGHSSFELVNYRSLRDSLRRTSVTAAASAAAGSSAATVRPARDVRAHRGSGRRSGRRCGRPCGGRGARPGLRCTSRGAAPRACARRSRPGSRQRLAHLDGLGDRRGVGDEDAAEAQRLLGVGHHVPRLGQVEHDPVEVGAVDALVAVAELDVVARSARPRRGTTARSTVARLAKSSRIS